MKFGLHGMITKHSNVISDIRIAAETGYEGLEIHTDKLWRYLHAGGTGSQLKAALTLHNITPIAIDIVGDVEAPSSESQRDLFIQVEKLCVCAHEIGAKTIQLNAFTALNGLTVEENIAITARNIKQIAKIGRAYSVRFQYEGCAWTPIHTLEDCMRLVDAVDEPNFGLVIDFWHFWASRGAEPSRIAVLPADVIFGVHCCGGIRPPMDAHGTIAWVDEKELRGYFPLQQDDEKETLPVTKWADAIVATGYDGWVTGEFLSDTLWELDNKENAQRMKEELERLFKRGKRRYYVT